MRVVAGVAVGAKEARVCVRRPARRYRNDILKLQRNALRTKRLELRPAKQSHITLVAVAVANTVRRPLEAPRLLRPDTDP